MSTISLSYGKVLLQHLRKVNDSKLQYKLSSSNHSLTIFPLKSALFPLGFTLLPLATKRISDLLKMCLNGIWIINFQKFGCAILMIISYFDPLIQSSFSYLGKHFKPSSCSCLLCRKRKIFTFYYHSYWLIFC